jgi:hypothetical protein
MHGEVDLVVMEAGAMEWDLVDTVVTGKFKDTFLCYKIPK